MMSFLIDTNIGSAYIKGNPAVWNKFVQHSGGIVISLVTQNVADFQAVPDLRIQNWLV